MLFDKNKANLPRVCVKTLQSKPTELTLTVNDVSGANKTPVQEPARLRRHTKQSAVVQTAHEQVLISADLIKSGVLNACLRAWE